MKQMAEYVMPKESDSIRLTPPGAEVDEEKEVMRAELSAR